MGLLKMAEEAIFDAFSINRCVERRLTKKVQAAAWTFLHQASA